MVSLLAIAVLCIVPVEDVVRERCDVLEKNAVYCPNTGSHTFTQLIFIDAYPHLETQNGRGGRRASAVN